MKIILISAVLLQITYSYAYPASQGVASFAYQDSSGNRYGGTYDLNDKLIRNSDLFTPFNDISSFYPNYFTNYDNIVQHGDVGVTRSSFRPFRRMRRPSRRIFGSDYESQRLASYAARKAYDLTYNQWPINQNFGYSPTFFRFPNFGGGFPFFGPGAGLSNMDSSRQAAFASAALGPGFSHQVAAIDPINIDMPNVDVTNRFSDAGGASGKPQFYSVSSSSFASSANDNGKVTGYRGAETVVNENGKVTKYKVES